MIVMIMSVQVICAAIKLLPIVILGPACGISGFLLECYFVPQIALWVWDELWSPRILFTSVAEPLL